MLHAQSANSVWRRNRNLHARLLLECVKAGRLREPFTSLPPPGPLPTLSRCALAPFLGAPERQPTLRRPDAKDKILVPASGSSCPSEQQSRTAGPWDGNKQPGSCSGVALIPVCCKGSCSLSLGLPEHSPPSLLAPGHGQRQAHESAYGQGITPCTHAPPGSCSQAGTRWMSTAADMRTGPRCRSTRERGARRGLCSRGAAHGEGPCRQQAQTPGAVSMLSRILAQHGPNCETPGLYSSAPPCVPHFFKDGSGHMSMRCAAGTLVLAGTRMHFANSAAAAHAAPALTKRLPHADAAHACAACMACAACAAPSAVQLEAALGAARERALEQELRVRGLERRLEEQVRAHGGSHAASSGLREATVSVLSGE